MKVNLDIHEMFYLLESCLRGSHLRSSTILRYVDDWYNLLSQSQRHKLYEWILRLVYDGEFKIRSSACGADRIFMARYNPDNQYRVLLELRPLLTDLGCTLLHRVSDTIASHSVGTCTIWLSSLYLCLLKPFFPLDDERLY